MLLSLLLLVTVIGTTSALRSISPMAISLRSSSYGINAPQIRVLSRRIQMSSDGLPDDNSANNDANPDTTATVSPSLDLGASTPTPSGMNSNEDFITGINDVKAFIAKMKLADKASQVSASIKDVRNTALYTKMSRSLLKTKNLLTGNGFTEVASSENQKNILADLGLNALLAYGFVSNLSYITCTWLAWLSHSKATKMSPLYPGQWKVYLTFYAGYWAANNILRPVRFSASLLLTPSFNKMIDFVQKKGNFKRRSVATGIIVFLVNILGTFTYLGLSIVGVSTLTGVPIFPPKSFLA